MSFDVNIGRTQPVIKAAANMNNDGGSGGNLGYMPREKKKNQQERKSLFDDEKAVDSFEMSSKLPKKSYEEAMELKNSWLENFISKFTK